MDTSETYIKMCEEAEEIQKYFTTNICLPEKKWDCYFIYDKINEKFLHLTGASDLLTRIIIGWKNDVLDYLIWLPRQDQLQEMMKDKPVYSTSIGLVVGIDYFATQKVIFSSMEQLWLAFIMKEKFNKTWNRKDWKEVLNDNGSMQEVREKAYSNSQ